MKISDELREFIDEEDLYPRYIAALRRIANRIDSEMVELPKTADGVPIHVGDTVYLDDVRKACVTEIDIKDDCVSIDCWDGSMHVECHPAGITHECPDSLESIAQDLEDWAEANHWSVDKGDIFNSAQSFADRIRKLAAKEGQR